MTHRFQITLDSHVTAILVGGPLRVIAWIAIAATALVYAVGRWTAGAVLTAGVAGASMWWALSKWRRRP